MKQLIFLALVSLLFSCETENKEVFKERSGSIFTISHGDSIYPGDNYDTVLISGLSDPFTAGQLQSIEISLTHPAIEELAIYVYSPTGFNATYYINDIGPLSGANLTNVVFDYGGTTNISTGSAPYTGTWSDISPCIGQNFDNTFYNYGTPATAVNGEWYIYIYNDGATTGYLSDFKMNFNY